MTIDQFRSKQIRCVTLMTLLSWRGFFSVTRTRAWVHQSTTPTGVLRVRTPAGVSAVSSPRRLIHCRGVAVGRLLAPLSSTASLAVASNETAVPFSGDDGERDASLPKAAPSRFVPFPFPYHHRLTLHVESLTNRGWGVGRVVLNHDGAPPAAPSTPQTTEHAADPVNANDDFGDSETHHPQPQKWVVMVAPGAIPGEVVEVRIFRNFPNYSEADVVQIVESSPHRVAPQCPVFGECGGCQYQHMSIDLQREWKARHVEDALRQYGIVHADVSPCLGTDETYKYRSKLTPHYQAPSSSGRRRNMAAAPEPSASGIREIGFQRSTSRQLVDVSRCAIATDPVNAAYLQLRDQLLASPPPKKRNKGATLLLRQADSQDDVVTTNHREPLTTPVLGRNFTYLAGNFFQNNYYVLPLMVQRVVEAAAKPFTATCGDSPTHLVDCYCGSGLFAVSASEHFETVVGIEINDRAVLEATDNAARNQASNCRFVAATAEDIFRHLSGDSSNESFPRDKTAVVLDPPRKGCSEDFLRQLLNFRPARIVYLSCDPTTQARDVRDILEGGDYEVDSVQPFDLFPQTRHIECLIVLNRRPERLEERMR